MQYAIWIPFCPLLAFFLIVFFGRKLPGKGADVAIAGMIVAFLLMLVVNFDWWTRFSGGNHSAWDTGRTWLNLGPAADLKNVSLGVGYMVDSATAVLLFVVTTVGTLIFVYAREYMQDDPWYPRFFAYVSLFAAAMLGVVVSDSLLWFFICWEIMGVCSYFLIGFWYEKPSAMRAAKKAFVVTRVGDVGFFLGILALYLATSSHTLSFSRIFTEHEMLHLMSIHWSFLGAPIPALTAIALLIFCGSIGKSAQFPLHVWLPDAMEGPTPVSALIHAATMVAAGVFLVARMYPVFAGPALYGHTSVPLMVVAGVGAFTAVFAASMALPAVDIKKVLAYSTISQLGYMFMGLGAFGYSSALFHLMTHAWFKALLFLGAGSIFHAVHTYDMREMGGLKHKMPITRWTFLCGSLALAGMFPFSGFFSKDAVLGEAYRANGFYYKIIFAMGLLGALLTAFYTFRMYFMVFEGEARDHHAYDHAHESPRGMTVPLMVLAVGATLLGFAGIPFGSANLIGGFLPFELGRGISMEETGLLTVGLMSISLLIVALGMWLAWQTYDLRKMRWPEEGGLRRSGLQPVYNIAARRWNVDELYMDVLVGPTMALSSGAGDFDSWFVDGTLVNGPARLAVAFSKINDWFDRTVVDGVVRLVAGISARLGGGFQRAQQGVFQMYALVVFGSVIVLVFVVRYLFTS